MPTSPRAARRAVRAGRPHDLPSLRASLAAARLPGHPPEITEQARDLLLAWLDAAGAEFRDAIRALSDGTAATRIGHALLARTPEPTGLACAQGCAFCCILPGEDGGTITAAEARTLHAALAPLGPPDGHWHDDACAALDPATRTCRAYDARPLICRSYVSRDAAACEAIAAGTPAPGTGTLPAQIAAVTAHALVRAALGTGAPTFSLRATARAATDGRPQPDALATARHAPRALDAERRRLARGLARAPRPMP